MSSDGTITVPCRPPHAAYFAVTGITVVGLVLWILLATPSGERLGPMNGLLILVLVFASIWFFGLYLPYRNCEYEITDTEIRIRRAGKALRVIPFDAITHVRAIERALTVSGPKQPLVYLYPEGAHDLIKKRVNQTRTSEQDPAPKP